MPRGMWEEIENRKTDETRIEKQEAQEKKEKKEKQEEIAIAKIVEEKGKDKDKEKDLIELRAVKEMVSRQFHKYLKVFEKKK